MPQTNTRHTCWSLGGKDSWLEAVMAWQVSKSKGLHEDTLRSHGDEGSHLKDALKGKNEKIGYGLLFSFIFSKFI